MLVNIVASILLAQRFGLVGVAYGTVVAFIVERILMGTILYIRHGITLTRYLQITPFAIYSIITCISYALSLIF